MIVNKTLREILQIFLLVLILFLQVVFLILSFNVSKSLTNSDIISIFQIILIVCGFYVAYRQIIFSRKVEEKNRIWGKIHSLESEYVGYRVLVARKFLNFLDDENKTDEELIKKYFMDMVLDYSKFRVKLDQVFDEMLYDTTLIKKAYENFIERDDKRIKDIMTDFIIALSSKSKRDDLISKEMKEEAKKLVEGFRLKLNSIQSIFETNDYKKFKEEVRLILR